MRRSTRPLLIVDAHTRGNRPRWNPQSQRELNRPLWRDTNANSFFKRIARVLDDAHGHLPRSLERNFARAINERGDSTIRRGVPEILHQLGPALMHVAGTARVAGQQPEDVVRVTVIILLVKVPTRA